MARTRIIATLKSPGARSTRNRQIPKQRFYSRQNAERFAKTSCDQEANRVHHGHRGHDGSASDQFFIVRNDERFKSNRDAGFAGGRRSLLKSANSRQAHREPV